MKENLKVLFKLLPLFMGITTLVIFSWVGAEYIIEKNVSFGVVDSAVAVGIAFYILSSIAKSLTKKGNY